MMKIKEAKEAPYYQPSKSFLKQAERGSKKRDGNLLFFVIKRTFNFILESIAYDCPVNSWRIKLHRLRGVNIGENVFLGLKVTLDHSYPDYIYIGDNVSLAGNNFVLTHSNPYIHYKNTFKSFIAPVVIKDGAWVSIGATILPGVIIGENSVVAASAVVQKDIPDGAIAGGIPAKVIRKVEL